MKLNELNRLKSNTKNVTTQCFLNCICYILIDKKEKSNVPEPQSSLRPASGVCRSHAHLPSSLSNPINTMKKIKTKN